MGSEGLVALFLRWVCGVENSLCRNCELSSNPVSLARRQGAGGLIKSILWSQKRSFFPGPHAELSFIEAGSMLSIGNPAVHGAASLLGSWEFTVKKVIPWQSPPWGPCCMSGGERREGRTFLSLRKSWMQTDLVYLGYLIYNPKDWCFSSPSVRRAG